MESFSNKVSRQLRVIGIVGLALLAPILKYLFNFSFFFCVLAAWSYYLPLLCRKLLTKASQVPICYKDLRQQSQAPSCDFWNSSRFFEAWPGALHVFDWTQSGLLNCSCHSPFHTAGQNKGHTAISKRGLACSGSVLFGRWPDYYRSCTNLKGKGSAGAWLPR